jgi:hypothetical protein
MSGGNTNSNACQGWQLKGGRRAERLCQEKNHSVPRVLQIAPVSVHLPALETIRPRCEAKKGGDERADRFTARSRSWTQPHRPVGVPMGLARSFPQ